MSILFLSGIVIFCYFVCRFVTSGLIRRSSSVVCLLWDLVKKRFREENCCKREIHTQWLMCFLCDGEHKLSFVRYSWPPITDTTGPLLNASFPFLKWTLKDSYQSKPSRCLCRLKHKIKQSDTWSKQHAVRDLQGSRWNSRQIQKKKTLNPLQMGLI